MASKTLTLLSLALAFALGIFSAKYLAARGSNATEEATVLLEKIEAVKKLVTVQGQFSEIYDYSEYKGFFTLLWDKKVLVRVQATVSAGYDLEQMQFEAFPETRTLRIGHVPEPKILAIEHDLKYYDLSNGLFESFSEEDYNRINQRAKDLVRQKAEASNLLQAAREQGEKTLDVIRFMAESAGWKVEIGGGNGALN